MEISAKTVKDLRDRTGAGMMDCKTALKEANGDAAAAETILRKQDKVKASKKAGRNANQGVIFSYIHPPGRLGVMVEINCETDFAAASDEFIELGRDVAMHVAAREPRYISTAEVTDAILDHEREIYRAQVENQGKPPAMVEKIVEGKLKSFYSDACLLEQAFVKDPAMTIRERMERTIGKIGENVRVRRFVRFQLGEASGTSAILPEES